ncbi:MAG: 2-C-methyl-D-erythritol 4-phosphate cytidylyltransferase [Simkaniaceae bacterium]|nr:MAG: 2-C-methyl-D-erythritol 4-phosphate cytidylyltransferase [Simkaniaceae bacterium]
METISLILLAGGYGTRMSSDVPKTFLPLRGKPMILHSFDLFFSMKEINEIVVVCPKECRSIFPEGTLFALPGEKRQDSVQNGALKTSGEILLIHDGARPLITREDVLKLLKEGMSTKAAALGAPAKNTIKQVSANKHVEKTLDRTVLYEMYTPQLLAREVYEKGYQAAKGTPLTDDVALAECINHPVKIVIGCASNIKITYPIDLKLAEIL